MVLPHERHIPIHEREVPPRVEDEPTHIEIMERLEIIEEILRRIERKE